MSEKNQEPTPRKLEDARKRGEVAVSRKLNALFAFAATLLFIWLGARFVNDHLARIVERAVAAPGLIARDTPWGWAREIQIMFRHAALVAAPLLLAGAIAAVLSGAMQVRGIVSLVPIQPKFERINPVEGLRRLFSWRGLLELAQMLLEIILLSGVLLWCIARAIDPAIRMVHAPAAEILRISAEGTLKMLACAAAVYAGGAALDYAWQRHKFRRQQRMSVEEIRREFRESEGDPLIKSQRRATGEELAYTRMLSNVQSATVVIANPTHVSVALHYVAGRTALPRVVAKGVESMALQIRVLAQRGGVPIVEDPPLARTLFREVALDAYITESLIEPTAAAFRRVRQVDGQQGSASASEKPTPRTV